VSIDLGQELVCLASSFFLLDLPFFHARKTRIHGLEKKMSDLASGGLNPPLSSLTALFFFNGIHIEMVYIKYTQLSHIQGRSFGKGKPKGTRQEEEKTERQNYCICEKKELWVLFMHIKVTYSIYRRDNRRKGRWMMIPPA